MAVSNTPDVFQTLLSNGCVDRADIRMTSDGFCVIGKDIAAILSVRNIYDFPDSRGERLACSHFFDDWFLYAVPDGSAHTYGLLKLREQEHDAEAASPADGDTPGVTISFVPFDCRRLLDCLDEPTDENRAKLNVEINRVVAYRGQRHHRALKEYFQDPRSQGAYLVADMYTKYIASFAENGRLAVPEHYKEIVQQSRSRKSAGKAARLPDFINALNQEAGYIICDNEYIYLSSRESLTQQEAAAILATHTANTSVFSFAAEVEYHARFLTPLARIPIPFLGRSVYDSAIRADMTVGDTELQGATPFYRSDSKIVKRQYKLHHMLRSSFTVHI